MLGDDTEGPAAMTRDYEFGARQEAFRRRLADSGITTRTVVSPTDLETAVLQALAELPHPQESATVDAARRRVWTIPPRVRRFVGRDTLLEDLEAALGCGDPAVVCAVTGMGGVGKTTTAIEYAHRHAAELDIAWWVPAEDPTAVQERLAELARALALIDTADPSTVGVSRLLGHLSGRAGWLVVFDNAEDPRSLTPFLPRGRQRCVGTRSPWRMCTC